MSARNAAQRTLGEPSWYDVLGVAPDADAAEIRRSWRAAIADLDPTDHRFTILNQAAEVLLDERARTAYDASLVRPEPPEQDEAQTPAPAAAPTGRAVSGWLLAAVAVLALLVAGAAVALGTWRPSDRAVADGTQAARAAAERAVVPILSYDAEHLDRSRAAARSYLTGSYREEYDRLFDGVIEENAPSTGTVLEASVLRSGVVRAGADRVQVFVFVNQSRTNKAEQEPTVYKNWVTVTMERVDGEWLVADLQT